MINGCSSGQQRHSRGITADPLRPGLQLDEASRLIETSPRADRPRASVAQRPTRSPLVVQSIGRRATGR